MKAEDQYLKFVRWEDEDNCYIGYCPDLFPCGGVCHGLNEEQTYRELCLLVREEVEELQQRSIELAREHEELGLRTAEFERLKRQMPLNASFRWDLAALGRLVEARGHQYPERLEEWRTYLRSLRGLAAADGTLSPKLDALVWNVFGPLLEQPRVLL